jgi:hypothetical protein
MTEKQPLADLVEKNKDYADAYDEESLWKKLAIMPRAVIEEGLANGKGSSLRLTHQT